MKSPLTQCLMKLIKYVIIIFSIEDNPYPCHSYMFTSENYCSKFTMSFWAPALKSPAENNIPEKVSRYVTAKLVE